MKYVMVEVALPYPPAALNPNNSRGRHWAVLRAAANAYKSDCWYLIKERLGPGRKVPDGDFALKITFVHGDVRPDTDNLLAALKAALDALAAALKIDDNVFGPLIVDRCHVDATKFDGPCVVVEVPCQLSS